MGVAAAGLAVLVGLLVIIWALQRRLIYFPFADVPPPSTVGLAAVEPISFDTRDGLTLAGWFVPSRRRPAWFTVIVFNGNGANRAYRAPLARALQQHDVAVLLFDYRGYGGNPGAPTEAGLAADARAVRAYALGRSDVDPTRLLYFGESLGSAVAVNLAADLPPAALILRSPFASLVELGRLHYPFLPVRWLLRDRFAAIDRIRDLRSPLLVIAGEDDGIVPLEQSRRLFAAAGSRKTMVIVPRADHNDFELLAGDQMMDAVVGFLRQLD